MVSTATFLSRGATVPVDCKVQLPEFEGPLDLLLYLIKNHELDLLNLPIAKITQQYLNYLNYMRTIDLDVASDYLVMAATLTYLKSQVILPQEIQEELTGPDPKAALIKKLIELKCYKDIAQHLSQRPRLYRDVFLAKNTGAEEIEASLEPEVQITNPFQMLEAYRLMIQRQKVHVHRVVHDDVPITHCVETIAESLKTKERISFQSLLPTVSRPIDVVSMFLGCLEMAKMQMSGIEQSETFGPIHIFRRVEPEQLNQARGLMRGLSWS